MAEQSSSKTIALIGLGTIGLSFAALHLQYSDAKLRLYDVRDDLKNHVLALLPVYLQSSKSENTASDVLSVEELLSSGRVTICSSIEDVCKGVDIVQESGPDSIAFKKSNWAEVVRHAPTEAHLWSSTSGIAASIQSEDVEDKTRILVVHPFNPSHIMPLIEIVPSPETTPERVRFAVDYFTELGSGHKPVVIKKETTGFVGNRLAFALLREACHLVDTGVASAEDIDQIVENSLGPRWAAAGPFRTYNFGGGAGGISAFLHHLGPTIEDCWADSGAMSMFGKSENGSKAPAPWVSRVSAEVEQVYGRPTPEELAKRDQDLKNIIKAQSK